MTQLTGDGHPVHLCRRSRPGNTVPSLRIHAAVVFEGGMNARPTTTEQGGQPTTIVEVADRARRRHRHRLALPQRPARSAPATATEIAWRPSAALSYRRNALAAAMKTDLTNTVGFMVP